MLTTDHSRLAPLYDANFEHDSCGVGLVVDIQGRPSRDIVTRALAGLRENRERLDSLAHALLEHETLDEADAYRAAGFDRPPPTPTRPPAPIAARDSAA